MDIHAYLNRVRRDGAEYANYYDYFRNKYDPDGSAAPQSVEAAG